MTFEELEELIRKYLSAGIAAVVVIVAPGTGTTTGGAPADPEVRILEPSDAPGSPAGQPAPANGGTGRDRTGTGNSPPATGSGRGSADGDGTRSGTGRDEAGSGDGGTGGDTGSDTSDTGSGSGSAAEGADIGDPDAGSRDTAGSDTARDDTAHDDTAHDDTADGSATGRSGTGDAQRSTGSGTGSGTAAGEGGSATASGGDGVTAAERFGWGTPDREDDFESGTEQWSVYDGPGHAGQGRRSPSAVTVDNGVLTITGDSSGTTAGMAWNPGQRYGRWEGRVRAPASDPSYHALLLLWPDAENFPVGGEIDFMEMLDADRRSTDIFIHYGEDNSQVNGQVEIDGTEWHNWALEWTPDAITAYVDGEEWFRTTDTGIFPPGPMHLCIQLDWFPEGDSPQESYMYVDWVRQYAIDETTGGGNGGRDTGAAGGVDSTGGDGGAGSDGDSGDSSAQSSGNRTGAGGDDETGGQQEQDTATRLREAVRRLFFWR